MSAPENPTTPAASTESGTSSTSRVSSTDGSPTTPTASSSPTSPTSLGPSTTSSPRRTAHVERTTAETKIGVTIDLDGTGQGDIKTPLPFLSHMVSQIARHGLFDLRVEARGDTEIDGHHTTEDLGIVLGEAVAKALSDRRGLVRYGHATLPMDEALVTCAIDLSGRPFFVWRVPLPKAKVGDFDVELAPVFFEAFARTAGANLHIKLHEGENLHHIVEICFKSFARALCMATRIDPRVAGIPSTKGSLV